MKFKDFSAFLQKLEQTASRNTMTEILADLFKKAKADEIDKLSYLSLGRLAPKFANIEFQFAEKLMVKAIAKAFDLKEEKVKSEFKKMGDLGDTIEKFKNSPLPPPMAGSAGQANIKTKSENLEITQVYDKLLKIAQEEGAGSVDRKVFGMQELLKELDALSGKYVVRMVLGIIRLGFSDMTLLDAFSWMEKNDKSLRKNLESAYNNCTDIGLIAKTFKKGGLKEIEKISVIPGIPIRPQQSERLETAQKIIEKLGKCAIEYKLDGLRAQLHVLDQKSKIKNQNLKKRQKQLLLGEEKEEKNIRIFSRNLESTTHMFPEVVEAAKKLEVESMVLDGEVIGIDTKTGRFLPFQETAQRKRKHGIEEMAKKIPVKYFVFDILYLNGKSLLNKSFRERRKVLEGVIK